MITWGTAFKKAGAILLWSLGWMIISSILIIIGAGTLFYGLASPLRSIAPQFFGGMIISIIMLVIGVIIGFLGTYASIVKVIADLIQGGSTKEADTSIQTLKLRFAKGEVSQDDYLKTKAILGD